MDERAMVATHTQADLTMNVQVSGRHLDLGEALRTRITDELVAGIGKFFDRRGGSADVSVSKDGHLFCVDVIVLLASGQQLIARGLGGDPHVAFDAALTKIQKRIRRYKSRLVSHKGPNGVDRAAETASLVVLRSDDEGEFDEEWGSDGSAGAGAPAGMIIAETRAAVKTQTVSMAVMELDLAEAPVILFRNVAHGGLSVVYRRDDGNIGWIDPERARPA
jgi:ribosomal subunit interface protein